MRSLKVRGLVLIFGASFLVGCGENTITSGPPSASSTAGIEVPKADTSGGGKAGLRPGGRKKPASGQAPSVPD